MSVRGVEGQVLHQESVPEGLRLTLLTDEGLRTFELDDKELEDLLEQVDQDASRPSPETGEEATQSQEMDDEEYEAYVEKVKEVYDETDFAPPSEEAMKRYGLESAGSEEPSPETPDQGTADASTVSETPEQKSEGEVQSRSEDSADAREPHSPSVDTQADEPSPKPEATPQKTSSPDSVRLESERFDEDVKETVLSTGLTPRPYQETAIQNWLDNDGIGILNMATGTGKTLTSLFAVDHLWPRVRMVVVACPTVVLVEQWTDAIREAFPESAIFEISGDGPWRDAAPLPEGPTFLVGTYHSLSKDWFRKWAERNLARDRTALITDEVHRSGAPTFSRVYQLPAAYRMGLSATPTRDWDQKGNARIRSTLDQEVFYFGLDEAIERDYLVPYTYHVHILPLTEEEREAYGEISQKVNKMLLSLGFDPEEHSLPTFLEDQRSENPDLVERIEKLLYKRSDILKEARGKERHLRKVFAQHDLERCLVYCNTKDQVAYYVDVLQDEGKTPVVYTSDQSYEERRQALRAFEEGNVDFIVAIRCLDEGVDIPEARDAILISSSSTVREYIQRRGRLLRPSDDKEEAAIHDLVVLPTDPETETSELKSHERAAIQKEFLRAYIFNRLALNRDENKAKIDECLEEFDVEVPFQWIHNASLREALERTAEETDDP